MKKYLLPFVLLLVILPLFGKVTIDESVPPEYRDDIEKALLEATDGRRDVPILFSSFSLEDDLVSFSIKVGESEEKSRVPLKYLTEEIENILFYNPLLFSTGDRVDFVSSLSFSTLSSSFSSGTLLKCVDEKGKDRGVFVVGEKLGEAFDLDMVYISSIYPGMRLEKKRGMDIGVLYALSPVTLEMTAEANISFYTPIYPFLPMVSIGFDTTREGNYGFVGGGVRTTFSFSDIWDHKALRNIAVDGRAEVSLRVGNGVKIGGRWGIDCIWRPISSFYVSLGYCLDDIMGGMISLSLGGLI